MSHMNRERGIMVGLGGGLIGEQFITPGTKFPLFGTHLRWGRDDWEEYTSFNAHNLFVRTESGNVYCLIPYETANRRELIYVINGDISQERGTVSHSILKAEQMYDRVITVGEPMDIGLGATTKVQELACMVRKLLLEPEHWTGGRTSTIFEDFSAKLPERMGQRIYERGLMNSDIASVLPILYR